ncbi:MAG: hypothetical protein GWN87_01410, partial [Desulfuromonadales bacterium]|nr:hypothetical protein [Desulfuromonadales bacterium]
MTRAAAILLFLVFLALAVFVLQREETTGPLVRTRLLMGTVIEIRVADRDAGRFDAAVSEAFAEMAAIEKLMSPHLPESEISRISTATEPLPVSSETGEVLQLAADMAKRSGGAFDPTVGRLVSLWGFAEGEPRLPAEAEIAQALAGVGS